MDLVIRILVNLVHFTMYIMIGDWMLALPRKKYKHWLCKFWGMIIIGDTIWSLFMKYDNASYFMNCVILFSYFVLIASLYMIFYEGEKKKLLFMSSWAIFFWLVAGTILMPMERILFKMFAITLHKNLETLVMDSIVVAYVFIIAILIKKNYRKGMKNLGIVYYISNILLASCQVWVEVFLIEFVEEKVLVEKQPIFLIVYLFITIGMLIQTVMIIFLFLSKNVYKENERLAAEYLNEQKNYYKYLEDRDRKTKKIRHDLASHLYVMQNLCLNKERDKLEEYMNVMDGEIDLLGNVISVSNGIVDAILNKYLDEAKKLGMELEVTGEFPLECEISDYDLCIIFSNLLSNALEIEKQNECGRIKVSCGYNNEEISICVENHVKEKIEKKNGKFHTIELDKRKHGFGLENVEECVKRNGGEMLIEQEREMFRVIIFLNNRVE